MALSELNFTNRESYFAWRNVWKQTYFSKIAEIRSAKLAFKNSQRSIEFVIKQYPWGPEVLAKLPVDYYKIMGEARRLVNELDKLVLLRQEARVKSGAQRLANIQKGCYTGMSTV
jgi:hypothetical protein